MPSGRARALRRISGLIARPASLPALIALIAVGLLGYLADYQNRQIFEQSARAAVADQLSVLRAQIEGNINRDIQMGRGVVAAIATNTRFRETDFNAFVERLLEAGTNLRSIAAAPDMVVTMVYPRAGNEAAMGLNYATMPSQRDAAFRVKESRQLVMAGPLNLVQGGVGIVARFPVEIARPRGPKLFWGIVSAVIDVDRLYDSSGITAARGNLDLTIRGKDGLGEQGDVFLGSADTFDHAPEVLIANLPGGVWQLAATPKGGWPMPPNLLAFRLMIVIGGLLVVLPILVTGHLYTDRRRNLDELARRHSELEKMRNRAELALETSAFGVWEYDPVAKRTKWDPRMYQLFGASTEHPESYDFLWHNRIHPNDLQRMEAATERAIKTRTRLSETYRIRLPDGQLRVLRSIGSVLPESLGGIVLGLNWDVTEETRLQDELRQAKSLADARNAQLEEANRRIRHTSMHDELTGLPNRRHLTEYLDGLGEYETEPNVEVAVLHIDLDRFKQVNDAFGHATGDRLLQHAARLMRTIFRPSDIVARIGGDEFVAVCLGAQPEALARKLAGELIAAFRQPIDLGENRCRSGVSVGIACAPLGGSQLSKLLIDADIALYRAKELGRNRLEVFTKSLEAEVVNTKRVADDILTGIEEGQFIAHYQQQFDATTRRLVGLEALVRWKHPVEGLITPPAFLGVAEDIGVLPTLDHIVLDTALADRRRWLAEGIAVPRIAVNVSVGRLHDEALVDVLRGLSIPPGVLSFELTEAIYLDDSDEVVTENIRRLKDLGIEIEIDDFGTGYASIVSLMRLQPNRLKIAHQLTAAVSQSHAQRQLIRSIVEIGRAHGIGIVAEGVETMEQADILSDLGCDTLQGYAFGRPMDADMLVRFLGSDAIIPSEHIRRTGSDSALFSAKL